MKRRFGLVMLVATTTIGCSEGGLTEDRAAGLITALEGFRRPAYFTIYTGAPFQSAFKCLSQAEVERAPLNRFAIDRGWVRYETRPAVIGFGTSASCPALALTPAGTAAAESWIETRVASGEGTAWAIPIGRRELVRVTRLTTAPDGATQAEFNWKWTPNETGTTLVKSVARSRDFFETTRSGRAVCRRPERDWRCELGMWTAADAAGEFKAGTEANR